MASSATDAYTINHTKLQKKYKCEQCSIAGPVFCYIKPGTTKHCRFNSSQLGTWATAIVNKSATFTCPPRLPEIEQAINDNKKSNVKEQVQPQNNSNNPTIVPIYLQPHGGYHRTSSPSPSKKRRRRRGYGGDYSASDDLNSSPIGNFEARDYYSTALEAYTSWCAIKFGDTEFKEAYQQLQKHKIGVDLLEDIELDVLTGVCGVAHGTAVRLKKGFAKWKASL